MGDMGLGLEAGALLWKGGSWVWAQGLSGLTLRLLERPVESPGATGRRPNSGCHGDVSVGS